MFERKIVWEERARTQYAQTRPCRVRQRAGRVRQLQTCTVRTGRRMGNSDEASVGIARNSGTGIGIALAIARYRDVADPATKAAIFARPATISCDRIRRMAKLVEVTRLGPRTVLQAVTSPNFQLTSSPVPQEIDCDVDVRCWGAGAKRKSFPHREYFRQPIPDIHHYFMYFFSRPDATVQTGSIK
jgi:hypothetical protein